MADEATPLPLSALTTMRVGGAPNRMLAPITRDELVDEVLQLWASGEDWLLLGGGSNTVAADEGFEGCVVRVLTRGVLRLPADEGRVRLRVEAGEPWDELVALAVGNGWSGIEALAGIPGSTGAAPMQNIGAYGQELASSLVAVEFLDYEIGEVRRLPASELGLGYRTSVFKRGLAGIVLAVELELADASEQETLPLCAPIGYTQLADALGVELGARVPIAELRRTVLRLRSSKGMVLDAADPDSVSAGSFFTNPIVSEHFARSLPADAPRWPTTPDEPDAVLPLEFADRLSALAAIDDAGEYRVKLSAAWLIERSGIRKGFALPGSRAAVSSKHTLALTNTGGASAAEVAQLASFVQGRVQAEFGLVLQPEPVLVGLEL